QILKLNGNSSLALPESIGNLSSLKELDLRDNKLTTLPESIGNLSSLKELDLRDNKLTTLPESIGNLEWRIINLSGSQLEKLYSLNRLTVKDTFKGDVGRGIGKNLTVKDAFKEDAGRGIGRIDLDLTAELNIKIADVVEIFHPTTNKKTAAILYPGKPEDKGVGIIRIDQSLRRNLGASLDDIVEIRKIKAALADIVIFAGLKEVIKIRNTQQLARRLENRVITKNDLISLFSYGRGGVDLVVVDFYPKADAVRIYLDTKFAFSEKSYREL
ncbi:MAG: leucine-rich repeat domain-containing protein, partial [Candidatus Hodarchaeota archaeon]